MNEERREQIRWMLVDIIDNMEAPSDYPSHQDFKRDWLFAVADIAGGLAREVTTEEI